MLPLPHFKKKIIIQTQKELKKLTDIYFEFEEVKTGRKVTSLKFYIHSNNKVSTNNEVSITSMLEDKDDNNEYITKIKSIMYDHEITSLEAKKIFDSSNANINIIEKVYNHFKNKQADNFIGLIIDQVRPGVFQEPKYNNTKTKFNDYEQRKYNYDDLEKKLLGLNNEEVI